MRKTIHLGEKILLDVNRLWRSALAVIGNSGSGKTLAGRELIEETYTYGSQVIFDLMKGELVTLREEFDYLLIGPNGDLPADPAIAADLARFVRDSSRAASSASTCSGSSNSRPRSPPQRRGQRVRRERRLRRHLGSAW